MLLLQQPKDILTIIFKMIGSYKELTILRMVSKQFKYSISKRHIISLKVNSKNISLFWKLSKQLLKVDCSKTKLSNLPCLPNCRILDCSQNKLTKLPFLPNCRILDCSENQLTKLPELPLNKELF